MNKKGKHIAWGAAALWLACLASLAADASPAFQQTGSTLVMSNGNVRVEYHLNAGNANFYWDNSLKLSNFYSGVTLNTGYIKATSYRSWSYSVVSSNQVVVTGTGAGLPVMNEYFTFDQTDSFLVQMTVSGTNLQANWMGPVVVDTTGGVNLGITNDNRALVVPFDNDGFVSYNAMPMNSSAGGYEVGAFYDNTSRNGLVVGSVTHDTWKTGIFFEGVNNGLALLNVFGGATSPWDVDPHGYVGGNTVTSPVVFVGFGPDWRVTMRNYAAENTNHVPRLAWTNGVPFGWNSWGVIQQNISYSDAVAVSDYFAVNLMNQHFADDNTVYINLDSFWNNLSNQQLQNFVNHCHAHGQKAGIYFGPFVWFGSAANATNSIIPGSTWPYSAALLRDHNGNFETLDGGLAMDPTHPGTRDQINYYLNEFTNWGFDYVKLDFLSHGTLEGVHYDPTVTTGIQAYNQGMQYVLSAIAGRMFISESIAPLFPYQYGHSRRISCDAQTSLIANTAYVMNSVSYGWWLDGLYQFNDPDIMVFGNGADTNEMQSRLISGAVTGIFLDGDDLTSTNGQQSAQMCLTNAAIDAVARAGQTFTPTEGNTGTGPANIFVRQNGALWSIAVFNYTAGATNVTVTLGRAGLPAGTYNLVNLWNGTTATVTGSFNVSLNAKQARLFQLAAENITWQAPRAISGAFDVSTQGMYFGSWAPYDGGANTLPVNGVAFQGYSDLPDMSQTGFNAGYESFPNPGTANANYNTLMGCGAYEYPGPVCTINWGGMTPGHTYLVEFWVNGNDASRTETFTVGTNTSGTINYEPGQYIIGTLVAAISGAVTVTLNGAPADNLPQVNLLQVRDITGAASAPVIDSTLTAGGNLIFSGSSGTAGGTYEVLMGTNLTTPIANWTPIASNLYDASGNFQVTNAMSPGVNQRFYTLQPQ
jgi:hypothetical protein